MASSPPTSEALKALTQRKKGQPRSPAASLFSKAFAFLVVIPAGDLLLSSRLHRNLSAKTTEN
jgi:hypothetical protein